MKIISIQECSKELINKFSCGNQYLDEYFHKYSLKNDSNNIGRTFILIDGENIIGFYTLTTAQIDNNELKKNYRLPKYPIPAIKIARFAINVQHQRKGFGLYLIKDAFKRIINISEQTGIKFIIVDAKPESKGFYENLSFKLLPCMNELTLILLIETLKQSLSINKKWSEQ